MEQQLALYAGQALRNEILCKTEKYVFVILSEAKDLYMEQLLALYAGQALRNEILCKTEKYAFVILSEAKDLYMEQLLALYAGQVIGGWCHEDNICNGKSE